jgi:hypothetical protein
MPNPLDRAESVDSPSFELFLAPATPVNEEVA